MFSISLKNSKEDIRKEIKIVDKFINEFIYLQKQPDGWILVIF